MRRHRLAILSAAFSFALLSALAAPSAAEALVWRYPLDRYQPWGNYFDPRGGDIHYGEDVPGAAGTPVRAAADGRVMWNKDVNNFQYVVIVQHSDGACSLYGHLGSADRPAVGSYVKRGQMIGRIGPIGHLHWGVHTGPYGREPGLWAHWACGEAPPNEAAPWREPSQWVKARLTGLPDDTDENGDGLSGMLALYEPSEGRAALHVWKSSSSSLSYAGPAGWWSSAGYDPCRVTATARGDFDGDGRSDLAAFYDYGGSRTAVHVWRSSGGSFVYSGPAGWWSVDRGYRASSVKAASAGDLDGDGRADLVALYDHGGGKTSLHVWKSTGRSFAYAGGSGWWTSAFGYLAERYRGVGCTDVDRDGRDDVVALYDRGLGRAVLQVWRSTGHSLAAPGWWWRADRGYPADRVRDVAAADFDGDGRGDLVALHDYGSGRTALHVWRSTGSSMSYTGPGGWWGASSGYAASRLSGLSRADLDGDGRADLAGLYDYGSGRTAMHVWRSRGSSFAYSGPSGWWSVTRGYPASSAEQVD